MRGLIVANPNAAAGAVGKRWHEHVRAVHACFGLFEVVFTKGPGDATKIVRDAIADGVERIIAVGGDGTVNEAVNGFVDAQGNISEAELGIFPLGTGGDFARSIGMRDASPQELAKSLATRAVDLGRVSSAKDVTRYFLNIASLGSSARVVDKVNTTSKRFGAKMSFLAGTLKGMATHKNQRVRLTIDDHFEEEMLVNTIAVANGRFFGGGMMIAPEARLDDGTFEVVVLGDIGVGFFVRHSSKVYAGTHTQLPEVHVLRGSRVVVTPVSSGESLVECDGESAGRAPVQIDLLPRRLRLVAPWSRAVV